MTAYVPVGVNRITGVDLPTAGVAVAASGDTFPPSQDNYLRVRNAGATVCNVTIMNASANAGPSGTFLAPLVLTPSVPITTGDKMWGPFPASTFADPSDGQIHVAYSFITTVTANVYNFSAQ